MECFLEGVVGCMCSGKTEELIRRLKRYEYAGKRIQVFRPRLDTRGEKISSRNGTHLDAITIDTEKVSSTIYDYLDYNCDVIAFEEMQFFPKEILYIITDLLKRDKVVIYAGLDMNYLGQPFGIMGDLLCISDSITKLTAICMKCGAQATHSLRNNTYIKDEISIGFDYTPVCRKCFYEYE